MKIPSLKDHNIEATPEEIIQRVSDLNKKFLSALNKVVQESKEIPHIMIASLGRVYVSFIACFVGDDPDEMEKASKFYAQLLINEMRILNELKKSEEISS